MSLPRRLALPILAAALSALAACGPPLAWHRAGTPLPDRVADLDACREQAAREAFFQESQDRFHGLLHYRHFDRFGRYDPFALPLHDRTFFRENRLTDFCMRAKGYQLQPVVTAGG